MSDDSLERFYASVAPNYDADYSFLGYGADIPYYVSLCLQSQGPVLEMGCGTGRILIPAARAGATIHGLDLSSDMLNVLENKLAGEPEDVRARVTLIQGDMRLFRSSSLYSLVLAPFRSVQHLCSRDDQRLWLKTVASHLASGGKLAFDVFQPDYRLIVRPPEPQVEVDRTDPNSGVRTVRTSCARQNPELQLMDVCAKWETFSAQGERVAQSESSARLRWFTKGELENLLELEGFRVVHYWGGFDRTPFGQGASQQIIEAVRR